MPVPPLQRIPELLPEELQRIVRRDTPIPTVAQAARAKKAEVPTLVRGDIGQIVGVDEQLEVLYGPPLGMEELRATVAETYNLAFGLGDGALESAPHGLTGRNVAVTTGAAEALSLLFRCFAKGKTVALPRGYWENYLNGLDMAQARHVVVDFFDASGALDIPAIERAIDAEGVAVMVVNFPCNPTGAVLGIDEYRALGQLVERTGTILIGDEVYARIRFDGCPPQTMIKFAPGNAVSVFSASKEYLHPGARVGYVVCAYEQLTDEVLRKVIRSNTASPNVLGQRRVLELMRPDLEDLRAGREPRMLTRIRDEVGTRCQLLLDVLERHGFMPVGRPGQRPMGTIFLTAALPEWWKGDDASFSKAAIESGCVSSVPGSAFGLEGSIRLSFGAMTRADIEQLDQNLTEFRSSLA
jgi:aspartate/methionine/tyrosine aminotransferase